MLKLVLDTNTLISAFFWEGNEADLFRKIEQGKADLLISNEILKKLKMFLTKTDLKRLLLKLV